MMDEGHCVRVTVTGSDASGEQISLTTHGILQDMANGWMLHYEETNPSDMSTAATLLHCEGERVTVTRMSSILSILVFDRQETFVGDYPTPYGNFTIRVLTSDISIKRRGNLGHIHVAYQVSLSTAFSQSEETDSRMLDVRFAPCRT